MPGKFLYDAADRQKQRRINDYVDNLGKGDGHFPNRGRGLTPDNQVALVAIESAIPACDTNRNLDGSITITPGQGVCKQMFRGDGILYEIPDGADTVQILNFTATTLGESATYENPISIQVVREGNRFVKSDNTGTQGRAGAVGGASVPFRLTEHKAFDSRTATAERTDELGARLPANAATDLTVATEAARLALVEGAGAGQVATNETVTQTDNGHFYEYLGSGPSDPDNWTDLGVWAIDIVVVDLWYEGMTTKGLFGLGPYTNLLGVMEKGFLGRMTELGDVDGDGVPKYCISIMEGVVDEISLPLKEDGVLGQDTYEVDVSVSADVQFAGNNFSKRLPERIDLNAGGSGGAEWGFAVSDPKFYLQNSIAKDRIIVQLSAQAPPTYIVVQAPHPSGTALVVEEITAASYDKTTKKLTYGKGKMNIFRHDDPGLSIDDDLLREDFDFVVFTSVEEVTPVDKLIHWDVKNGRKMITVEPCNTTDTTPDP